MKSESQKKTKKKKHVLQKWLLKLQLVQRWGGKVIWCSLTMSVICALYIFSVGIFEEEKKKKSSHFGLRQTKTKII